MPNSSNEFDAVKLAIAARSRDFESRFGAGDAAGLVEGYFVPDVANPMASPPGGQRPLKGRAALVDLFTAQLRDASAIRLETEHLDATGDMAFELGRAHLTLRTGQEVKGRYTVLWKRWDGEWRAVIDFFAADGWQD
jgi:ketosteroid isomerase-like protein